MNVLRELLEIYPNATIFTSVYNEEALPEFKKYDVQTTFLQKIPLAKKKHQLFGVLRQFAFERLDLSEYDLVLSQTTAESKSVKTRDDQLHICYCNSPVRYYWSHYDEYLENPGLGALNPLAKLLMPLLVPLLRKRDLKAAARPDHYIANSHEVQKRIEKYYLRGARVIFPPVDTDRFKPKQTVKKAGFVITGRQVPYKKLHVAVQACTELDLPLTVVGDGPGHQRLVDMAGDSVTFITDASNDDVVKQLQSAGALIFPNLEDFGIVPVEAMAAGTPVIAYRAGGALDTVVDGVSGRFFDEPTVESLKNALLSFNPADFDPEKLKSHAERFSNKRFRKELREFIAQKNTSA